MKAQLPLRGCDDMGCGHYGASRGRRTHKGIDYACLPDTRIYSPCNGTVTKLGWPYKDEAFRYVEITDAAGNRHRTFYIDPLVSLGDEVYRSIAIGEVQNIAAYHGGGMKNHVHYEVISREGKHVDPESIALLE